MVTGHKDKFPIYSLRKHGNKFMRVFSRHDSHKVLRLNLPVDNNKYTVVRLGSMTPAPGADIEINSIKSIVNCSNKIKMKDLMVKAGVSTPTFYTIDPNNLEIRNPNSEIISEFKYPLIAKRNKRSGGVGMIKIDTAQQFEEFLEDKIRNNDYNKKNNYYLEHFANYIREYRIHVSSCGHYFYSNRKMLPEGTEVTWFRNSENCVWITEENKNFNKPNNWNDIIADCQKAREAIGLDICGFDVKVNKKGEWAILEANSACSFGDNPSESITAIKYKKELLKIQKSKI